MTVNIGYPDYFDEDNASQLEEDYAEVRNEF